jgi:hypothetical protein
MSGTSQGVTVNPSSFGQLSASPLQPLTPAQIAQMYNGYNSQSAQQQAANQYGQMMAGLGRSQAATARWMFDGRIMDLVSFANEVFGEDTPEATYFVLKHSK